MGRVQAKTSRGTPHKQNDAASLLSKEALRLYEVQRNLLNLGIDDELEIPKLVVCGDQSAGKSSVMERICGVPLPRAAGTCTRCPMELHVIKAEDESWSCHVKLRFEEQDKPRLVSFGDTIHDKSQVKDVVRRAQAAVLNPDTDPEQLLSGDLPEDNQLKFTTDPVVLEIRDPELTNLTLVDLPGIMRSLSNADDQKYVDMVRNLTKQHISKPEAIVVAAIACTTDMENQEIFQLAREADPDGERTIGVLTKVDRIETGNHGKWVGYMNGNEYGLRLGYYMLRNPTQEELDANATRQDTDAKEAEVFESEPFRNLAADLKTRMGLGNLVGNLSSLLLDRLRQSLPGLKAKAKARLNEIDIELATLPQLIPEGQISELVRQLVGELCQSIEQGIRSLGTGGSVHGSMGNLAVELALAFTQFHKTVADSKPLFILKERDSASQVLAKYGRTRFDVVPKGSKAVTMTEVQDIIREHKGLELPGHLPYKATLAVISRFQSKWYCDAEECLETAQNLLSCKLDKIVHDIFKDFPRLHDVMQECVTFVTEDAFSHCKERLKEAVRAELALNPYTVLEHDFLEDFHSIRDGIKKQMAELKSPSLAALNTRTKLERWNNAVQQFPELAGITSGLAVDQAIGRLLTLQGDEDWAVTIMATSMAYFIASSRRICETVPTIIRTTLKEVLATTFKGDLERRLTTLVDNGDGNAHADTGDADGLGRAACYSHPHVISLVMDDPRWRTNTNKRGRLTERAAKLQSVLKTLHMLS